MLFNSSFSDSNGVIIFWGLKTYVVAQGEFVNFQRNFKFFSISTFSRRVNLKKLNGDLLQNNLQKTHKRYQLIIEDNKASRIDNGFLQY